MARPHGLVLVLALASVLGAGACRAPQPVAAPATAPGARCSAAVSQERPLIIEWSASDRTDLETQVRKGGAAVVRYSGCELTLLRRCKAPVEYEYVAGTRQDEEIEMRDVDELYAKMPIGAASLEATVEQGNAISVAMSVVGKYVARASTVSSGELTGPDCAGATHVVVGLTTGSFEMMSGASRSAGADVGIAGIGGAGGRATRATNVLRRGGSTAACDRSTTNDTQPPEGCSAFLRLELARVKCPSSLTWAEGKGCVSPWEVDQRVAAVTAEGNPADAPLARLMVDAAYTLLAAAHGETADPKYRVTFKQHVDEIRETVAEVGLGSRPPMQFISSSVCGSSPAPDGRKLACALFYVLPPGNVRWGGLSVSPKPSYGAERPGPSFGDADHAWLAAHDRVMQAKASKDCAITPVVTPSELAAIPLPSDQRSELEALASEYRFDAARCASLRPLGGPWQMEETRMYAVFGDGKKGFVLFAALVPKRNEIVLYDAKISSLGG